MNIEKVEKVIMPDTYEIRYYFNGYITPEHIMDVKTGAFGLDYEDLGKQFIEQINELRKKIVVI
jgi:hypothetical protein